MCLFQKQLKVTCPSTPHQFCIQIQKSRTYMTRHITWTAKGIRLITSDLNCKSQHAVLKHLQSGYVNITSSRNKYIIFHLWIELVASLESQLVQGSTKLTTKQKEPHIAKPTVCPNGPGLVSPLSPASHSCTPPAGLQVAGMYSLLIHCSALPYKKLHFLDTFS